MAPVFSSTFAVAAALLYSSLAVDAVVVSKDVSKNLRSGATSISKMMPFYHTTDEISAELKRLAGSCQGLTLKTVGGPERSIDVVTMKRPGANPVNKNFILFGEHARELISPESGLHFIKSLCGETDLAEHATSVLQDNEYMIVVNGNPDSRRKVEQGDFCLRTNPNGVDLNRNWAEHWQAETVLQSDDTNPGPEPFSEPETKAFKQLVTEYRPTTFLTIHSGTRGMYMPWAYDMEHLAKRNQPEMMEILRTIDKNHCQCPFGAAGREVGYSCPGTCLDWVYDELKTDYAFAFEIFVDRAQDADLKARWEEKMTSEPSFLQFGRDLAHEHFRDVFESHPSCFVQLKQQHHKHRSHFDCFTNFNPTDADQYKETVENWSGAYLDMAAMIAKNLKANKTATTEV